MNIIPQQEQQQQEGMKRSLEQQTSQITNAYIKTGYLRHTCTRMMGEKLFSFPAENPFFALQIFASFGSRERD